ncbi:DUF7266 family protein [Natrarchaeobaculum sulfurireducens]|uniref:Pilin/Flagellin, FlaG/FlaF family n=1 Tax=Natrarchaeobaculum sulfurireducens TaxID=2044521 RepID=A0A346PGC9_9EURY|nr:hypothetical protein [Natrarchaeobaculum sulfurireducens]AXR78574.1 Pilin/Flagellin, FlaG/FlaF family [Natrarchaeobaculum sulfurireducens]AXR81375.1 hypothetical protein AArcMg_1360 [Natrarchaeobaculum sulfurireducens]
MIRQLRTDHRGTSIAITHVLTIGITTLLIAVLLTGAGGLLETETDRSAETSLETVGERLAGEIHSVDQLAVEDGDRTVTVTANHPRTVANSGYTVEILESSDCANSSLLDGSTECLELTSQGADVTTYVPVKTDTPLETGASAPGGTIDVTTEDGNVTIRGAN